MTTDKRLAARGLPLLLLLGLGGLALGAGPAASTDEPVTCEIQTDSANGMITLMGVVHADAPMSGSYRFRVKSAGGGGSANISQGGGFTAGPGQPATLGQVMLGGGGTYDATLTVIADGVTVTCDERVGGAI